MKIPFHIKRLLTALLALLALATGPAMALADGDYLAVVSAETMSVYARKAPHALLGTLPKGTLVTVKRASGEAALISFGGKTGLVQLSDLNTAADEGAQAEQPAATVVANRATRIYRRASTSSSYSTVPAGTSMQLLAVNGNCARVSRDGQVGYVVYSHLGETAQSTEGEPVKAVTAAVVTNQKARVYSGADNTGSFVTLNKGAKLTLLAVRGDCAMVEKSGAIGYISVGFLDKDAAAETPAAVKTAANPFPADSNEHAIYAFLIGEMGYNRAAAMGVMANIKFESGYRTAIDGDGGTSYGICQWHAGRKTNLINYCAENNLDYTTLEGQLQYFKYEITSRYPTVHNYLKQVENTADGAYDAGYYFCFNFEAPAARTSQSTKRGEYAKDTLFVM